MLTDSALIRVRRARASDSEALERVAGASWRLAYAGVIPHAALERMMRVRDGAWWRTAIRTESHMLVVEVSGIVAGYATCGAARNHPAEKGEIYELYVDPIYQGMGIGEYLFEACRHQLDLRALRGLIVWALADNNPAIEFYRRRGGRVAHKSSERFGRTLVPKVGIVWA